jgi:hypothetical protein
MAILLDENEAFTKQFMRIQILTTRNWHAMAYNGLIYGISTHNMEMIWVL